MNDDGVVDNLLRETFRSGNNGDSDKARHETEVTFKTWLKECKKKHERI